MLIGQNPETWSVMYPFGFAGFHENGSATRYVSEFTFTPSPIWNTFAFDARRLAVAFKDR